MHLKSLTMKGFKSFPDRTRLEFGPGVSVIVGPNGSGKSNVTDAVLWALGEQSPLAVRGASMQDVIFGGGRGVQARNAAEVELVIDNGEGSELMPMSEISILRRLDRSGDGEYRLNGAKCRLVDVLEVLSDTGLGKEMHSVVSQGRIEAIVTSKPRDRRLLIEEAAGLGKHRKRRRRAHLKLERTQDNLDRALDVEREARSRLRPLKRQAEAAELHERLERQSLEARWELARETTRARRAGLADAEAAATAAKAARDEAEVRLRAVAVRREAAEAALQARSALREELSGRVYRARGASDKIELRGERAAETATTLAERIARRGVQIAALEAEATQDAPDEAGRERVAQLEAELVELDRDHEAELERELVALEAARVAAAQRAESLQAGVLAAREALKTADAAAEAARRERREGEKAVEAARREAARVGAELAAANQFLRSHAGAPGGAKALAGELAVADGYELALAAALDGRLGAALVEDLSAGAALLDKAGRDGGRALVADPTDGRAVAPAPAAAPSGPPPVPGAVALATLVGGPATARRLLADVWVVDALDDLPADFAGVAVTRTGRAWSAATRELRQVAAGGAERVLAERNRRDRLIAQSQEAIQAEQAALAASERAGEGVAAADTAREEADRAARQADRERSAAAEELRRAGWLIEQRRKAPQEGAGAVRRAQLEGELAAERRTAERAQRERAERGRRLTFLRSQHAADVALESAARKLAQTLKTVIGAVANRVEALEAELAADRAAGEGVARELRDCAREEAEIQTALRQRGDQVTATEVRAQQARDAEAEATAELGTLAETLGLDADPAPEPLDPAEADALRQRIERLARRREQLGPVNPLAQAEYAEAVAHVEELETQREDLETALRELKQLIRDTDREIRETFETTFNAAAENFEQLAQDVFPGGRGKLRLVREDSGPRPVLGGQDGAQAPSEEEIEAAAEAEDEVQDQEEEDLLGVEIEITPAGKSSKRLTLLSGGEKSMTAVAFLFAVFLAKPCPFYILDEVEAALDDLNLERFLTLLTRYADRAQFIVVTHQKKTMDAADSLYGVSMGGDGVSKVISRRLPGRVAAAAAAADAAA
jgi:chromosome segregation protein